MSTTKKHFNLTTGGGTILTVANFLTGVVSPFYLVKLIHLDRSYVIARHWDAQQVKQHVDFMAEKNRSGFHVYIRPADARFILLDDLCKDRLSELAELKPCLLMETSPGNYQAWLKLHSIPQEREQQTYIWRTLAAMFEADPLSAKPDQIGRLTGFYNMKLKYSPDFPMVKLHRYQDRFSTWEPADIPPAATRSVAISPPVVKMKSSHDRSGFDWAVTCDLVKRGWSDDNIRSYLEKRSHKAATRKDDYLGRTISKARRSLKKL